MFCVVAFFVLLVLGAVSTRHRGLFKKTWECMTLRARRRPCDTTFREDLRNSLLAPIAMRTPRLVKPADIAITVGSWVIVLTAVVSIFALARSGIAIA